MALLSYHYTSNSGAYSMHPPLSILREVFSYTARFLPSKDIYLFCSLNILFIFFPKTIGLWKFLHSSPCHRHLCFTEGFIFFPSWLFYWNILFIFTESIGLLKVFFIFPSSSVCHGHLISLPVNTGAFLWVLSFFPPLFVHNAMSLCASRTKSCKYRMSWRFFFFPLHFSPMPVMHQHWGAECSVYMVDTPPGLESVRI